MNISCSGDYAIKNESFAANGAEIPENSNNLLQIDFLPRSVVLVLVRFEGDIAKNNWTIAFHWSRR